MLLKNQISFYEENGYLLIPNYASPQEIQDLKNRMKILVENLSVEQRSIFSTNEQNRTSDKYFLESGDKIRCFFEETASKDGTDKTDGLETRQQINKIGHALHELDEVYKQFSYQKKLGEIMDAFDYEDPAIIQSQYIFKSPRIGGNVTAHTDSTFIYTDPHTCLGVWIALEDADQENGCLWTLPGSHKLPLKNRFVRNRTNDGTLFIDFEGEEIKDLTWDLDKMIPIEAKAGDAVLLHGQNVHLSHPNHSNRSRNAYVLHLIDRKANYPSDNWLQRGQELPLRSLKEQIKTMR